ncbi:nuclear pore complex protein DDB_G0274915 [Orussus abietinus]|uniref:nuclear pore complex protein DDB_G0274915 n=1 Tax=Orussus abietinus TaxID=222816 RepID=UPI00062693CD|nr:nuclear pore complex protein DDB_G0274915 [Orussus abietinus]
MWDLGNRGVLVLVSVLSGCVLLYNAWGPILALTLSLFLVVFACYSLIANDTVFTPHADLVFRYLREASYEAHNVLGLTRLQIYNRCRELLTFIKRLYRQRIAARVSRHRAASTYHTSSDLYHANASNSPMFSLIDQLSPISCGTYRSLVDDISSANSSSMESNSRGNDSGGTSIKHTSTPLHPWRKENSQNGGPGLYTPTRPIGKKTQTEKGHDRSLENGSFGFNGSPWGISISPKMRSKAAGVKTVQTVAGPLLASTRYNIDPKVYADVNSPGFSTRLVKYATEASKKLTHQSQYAAGQFPKINLHASPAPLLSAKAAKMRMPVTVRIAPPDQNKYNKYSPPQRQQVVGDMCHLDNNASPSVVQVLREISLKRHASREDITADLVKKQRTDGIYGDNLENLEEMTQKRSRDESSKSEDEITPEKKSLRPIKRTKTPSCYDILNSLSSSAHVQSGVKRKAMDISRSGTPDPEKHFKSLDNTNASLSTEIPTDAASTAISPNDPSSPHADVLHRSKTVQEHIPLKGATKSIATKESKINGTIEDPLEKYPGIRDTRERIAKQKTVVDAPTNLTDKLFMRAEPQHNEKLKSLIEEQGNIKVRFTTNDMDEIKKEDIVTMRQVSMRARLQSMFDAISGKASNKINPDIVIQAEEVTTPAVSSTPATTLTFSTSTTDVNTSPLSTSAVASIIAKPKSSGTPRKHVTFLLPTTESQQISESSVTESSETTSTEIPSATSAQETSTTKFSITASTPITSFATSKPSMFAPTSDSVSSGSTIAPASNFSFGTPIVTTTTQQSTVPATPIMTPSATMPPNTPIQSVIVFGTPVTQSSSSNIVNASKPTSESTLGTQPSPLFSFGPTTTTTSTPSTTQTATSMSSQKTSGGLNFGTPSVAAASNTVVSPKFNTTTASVSTNPPTSTFTFGANSTNIKTSTPEGFSFNTPAIAAQSTPLFGSIPTTQSNSLFGNTSPTPSFAFPTTSIRATNAAPSFNSNVATTASSNFGSNITTTASPAFGSNVASTASSLFGTNVVTTASPTFGSNVTTASPSFGSSIATASSVFGANVATTVPSGFGSNIATTAAAGFGSSNNATPLFSFGTTSAPGSSNNQSTFSFGGNAASSIGSASTGMNFGSTTSGTTSSFETPATTTAAVFGATTTTTSVFGTPSSTSVFGTPTSHPSFAGTSASSVGSFGTPKTTVSKMFTPNTTTPVFGATNPPPSLFGNVNTNASTATTSSIFGQVKSPPAFGSTPPSFGSGNASVFGTSNTSTSFGTAAATTGASTPAFGGANPTTNTMAPVFGVTNLTTTAAPAFGASSTAAPTIASTFGSTTSPSGFGTQTAGPAGPATAGQTSTPIFGASGSAFGASTAVPVFGTNTTNTTTPGFATPSTSSFGAQNNASLSFGATSSSTTGFGGSTASPFGSQTSTPVFGSPTSTVPVFGTASTSGASNTFTFGGNQPQAQQNSTFSNNSSSNNNTASGSSPFQFGSATSKPSGGFNFTAPSGAPNINFSSTGPPSFGASAPGTNAFSAPTTGGMFSIGTGSTVPRSKNPRQRRQR